jgi:Deoxyribodipyrimidine photolyase
MTALLWFRRDLRVHDHPALRAALDEHEQIVPVFCLDDRLLHGRHASGPRTQFLLESLTDLDSSLRERGGGLVVRRGRPERELTALARETGAKAVYFTRDVSPFARERGELAHRAFSEAGLETHLCPGLNIVDDVGEVRTRNDDPYTVFSPFWRNWMQVPRRDVMGAPRRVELPQALERGEIPSLSDLGLGQEVSDPPAGGEGPGRQRMSAWLRAGVRDYDRTPRLPRHRGHLTPVALPALRLRLASRARGSPAGRGQGRRGLSPPALLARLLPRGPARLSRQRPPRVPGALPRSPVVPRREAVRGLDRRAYGLPARRRRHAPAPP